MNRRMLRATAGIGALFAGLFTGVALLSPEPRLLWNMSPSVPMGLYRIDVAAPPQRGDLVAIRPQQSLAGWLASRRYLPLGVPLLKRFVAGEGALICRSGAFVTIDGAPAARARATDRLGRPLPLWLGCRRLGARQLFLLGTAADSLDGRYFGPTPASAVIGVARPLITRAAPGAPLRWRSGGAQSRSTTVAKDNPS